MGTSVVPHFTLQPGLNVAAYPVVMGDHQSDKEALNDMLTRCTARTPQSIPHSLTHSHTHTLTHSRTHALTHSLTHALTHSRTHALTHSCTHALTHLRTHALTHLRTHACSYRFLLTTVTDLFTR